MSRVFLIISLIINAILGFLFLRPRPVIPNLYQVDRVIDGDTFIVKEGDLSAGRQIRLMSVNSPEVGLCGSAEATAKLKELIDGKKVRLVGDLNDHYGRLLALVYVDDQLINKEIILSGWARFTSTASSESENLKSAFQKIKTEKLGVFSSKCYQTTNPQNPKCNIKGNVKEGKKIYFFPGCGNYSNVALELDQGDQWFCSESAATSAGFTKSANCYAKVYY
ncbi:MAG: thermonuclease family protein [Candidatus Shapirobacteria bacterium]|nr:thermonuclease family protein [Candidatus Shapirobacteria bacterium]